MMCRIDGTCTLVLENSGSVHVHVNAVINLHYSKYSTTVINIVLNLNKLT